MPKRTAHILEERWRSDDIRTSEDADFSALLLPDEILQGLLAAGFKYPSPIQLEAIPAARVGKDLIIQAKSGTGKTLVFAIAALNMLLKGAKHPQVLILAPTREIACQISQVINSLCVARKDIKCEYFIGGCKSGDDVKRIEKCQIVVGSPGRIKYLVMTRILRTSGIRLLVLDEADQLLRENSFIKDVDDIFRALPRDKQIIATSATFSYKLKRLIEKYFREPMLIRLSKKKIGLLGMVHYYCVIPVSNLPVVAYKLKLEALRNVLCNVKFGQSLVFCNMVSRVENLCVEIKNMGFATSFISSARKQEDRLKAIEMLRRFKCKVLVSSDVSSRGIDAENVDLVINFDLPFHLDIYFHRVGRAGRYGSRCTSVSFITSTEIELYQLMQKDGQFTSYCLPDNIPSDLINMEPPEISDDEIKSSSDLENDAEDINENGYAEAGKTNAFVDCIQLNSKNFERKSDSDSDSDADDLNENENTLQVNTKEFNLDSNPASSDCVLSTTSQCLEPELNKSSPSAFCKIRQRIKISEVIVAEDEENSNLKNSRSNTEELCINDEPGKKLDQQNCVASMIEGTKNDSNSYLAGLESSPEKSIKGKIINDKLPVMNNECGTSKNFSNPISKELIGSVITFIEKYEKHNKDSVDCSSTDSTQSSQSINAELKDNKFTPMSLISLRSNLGQYYYNTYKEFLVNIPEVWIKEIAIENRKVKNDNQVLENESHSDLKQIDNENNIPDSNLNLQHPLFSTPKAGELLESDEESTDDDDENKLTEHFNSYFMNRESEDEIPFSDTDADIMINSKLAKRLLNEEFIEQFSCNKEIVDKSNEKAIIKDEKSDSSLDASIEILYDTRQQRMIEEIVVDDTKSSSDLDASDEFVYVSRKQGIKEKNNIREAFVNKNSMSISRSDSGSNLDTSMNDKDTMDMLEEAFNKDRAEIRNNDENPIINDVNSSVQILHDASPKKRYLDDAFDGFVNRVVIHAKEKQNNAGSSKDTKNMSKFPPEMQSTDKCIKPITKVNTKKPAETPSSTSVDSRERIVKSQKEAGRGIRQRSKVNTKKPAETPSSTSVDSRERIVKSQKEFGGGIKHRTKMNTKNPAESTSSTSADSGERIVKSQKEAGSVMQNGKNEVANIKKSSIYKTKTIKGPFQNKITYYFYSSQTESDVDQYSVESQSSPQDHEQHKAVTKTDNSCRAKLKNRPVEKKAGVSNSESSSSEIEISCDQNSQISGFNPQDRHYMKQNPKKDETRPKTGPFGFCYSNDTLNPYLNPTHVRPSSGSCHSSPLHIPNPYSRPCSQRSQSNGNQRSCCSSYQMQLSCGACGQCNDQCSRQSQNHVNQMVRHSRCQMPSAFNGPNPNHQKHSQQTQNHRYSSGFSADNFNSSRMVCPSISIMQSIHEMEQSHDGFNQCVAPSQHPCHPPNESCQSLACAAWYDIFCKQWELYKQSGKF